MTDAREAADTLQEYFSVAQVAKRLGCSTKHVRRLINRGDLVANKFGGIVRISRAEIERYERLTRQNLTCERLSIWDHASP